VVRFLNAKIGFAFSRDDKLEPINEPGVANPQTGLVDSGRLHYSDEPMMVVNTGNPHLWWVIW